MERIRSD